jgi:hypothetical protein
MFDFLLRWLRAPLPRVGSLWVSRATGSRYEVCAVEETRRRVWWRLYSGGIVKQPRECASAREFRACFAPLSVVGRADRLRLRRGDTVVLTLPLDIGAAEQLQLLEEIRARFPRHSVVVLPCGATLSSIGAGPRHTIGSDGAAPAPT